MHEKWMIQAIEQAKNNLGDKELQGGPFGAVIVKDKQLVATGYNQVLSSNDPTAHAEIVAIRNACREIQTFDLSDCVIYTSCEPCPMCLSAIYWARLNKVYYAATKNDAASIEFIDDFIYQEFAKPHADRQLNYQQLMRDEAWLVMQSWYQQTNRSLY